MKVHPLHELIGQLRAGDLTVERFGAAAAAKFVYRTTPQWPETDTDPALWSGVSNATISNAVARGDLTVDEAKAIYDALPARR